MKKVVGLLTVIALVSMMSVAVFAADSSVKASQDCYIRQDGGNAEKNFNMDPDSPTDKTKSVIDLRYKPSDSKNRNVFLDFDVKGLEGVTIESVKLVITSTKMGGNTTFDVFQVNSAWDEKTITWNTSPKYDETAKLGSYADASDLMTDQQVTVDLDKGFIKGDGKYSIVLVANGPASGNDDSEFYSKENTADKAAKLVITYSGTPTSSATTTTSTKTNASGTSENPETGDPGVTLAVVGLLTSAVGAGYISRKHKK